MTNLLDYNIVVGALDINDPDYLTTATMNRVKLQQAIDATPDYDALIFPKDIISFCGGVNIKHPIVIHDATLICDFDDMFFNIKSKDVAIHNLLVYWVGSSIRKPVSTMRHIFNIDCGNMRVTGCDFRELISDNPQLVTSHNGDTRLCDSGTSSSLISFSNFGIRDQYYDIVKRNAVIGDEDHGGLRYL